MIGEGILHILENASQHLLHSSTTLVGKFVDSHIHASSYLNKFCARLLKSSGASVCLFQVPIAAEVWCLPLQWGVANVKDCDIEVCHAWHHWPEYQAVNLTDHRLILKTGSSPAQNLIEKDSIECGINTGAAGRLWRNPRGSWR